MLREMAEVDEKSFSTETVDRFLDSIDDITRRMRIHSTAIIISDNNNSKECIATGNTFKSICSPQGSLYDTGAITQ